jgi:hypothetical protein
LKRHAALSLLLLALTFACGRAERGRTRDEAFLRTQLATMRRAITAFTKTHSHGPATLREATPVVPIDPLTHSATTWRLTTDESVQTDDFTTNSTTAPRTTIIDVHSGAAGRDGSGRAYSDY